MQPALFLYSINPGSFRVSGDRAAQLRSAVRNLKFLAIVDCGALACEILEPTLKRLYTFLSFAVSGDRVEQAFTACVQGLL
jgi:hypothetical protein